MTQCTLKTKDGFPVPLRGVELSGDVFGGHAHIVVRKRFRNDEPHSVEAVYTFPLPSDGTLAGFSMECDGRTIEGVVMERDAAFAAYDDALVDGHGAALADEERANVFTASVGNLLPGEETRIEMRYIQRLLAADGALRLMIPTLVAPRYVPSGSRGPRPDRTACGTADPPPPSPTPTGSRRRSATRPTASRSPCASTSAPAPASTARRTLSSSPATAPVPPSLSPTRAAPSIAIWSSSARARRASRSAAPPSTATGTKESSR